MNNLTLIAIAVLLAGSALATLAAPRLRRWSLLALPASGAAIVAGLTSDAQGSWWSIDPLGGALALLAIAIAGCVLLYADRQFEGERRGGSLMAAALVVVAGLVATDLAANLVALLLSWTLTSLATVGLLAVASGLRPGSPARLAAKAFALVDGFLLLSFAVALLADSELSLAGPISSAGTVLLIGAAVAAMGRAGFSPRRSWVVATVQAPTAVSALLHAGVVNAGALLLLRTMPLSPTPWVAQLLVGLVSAAVLVHLAPRIHARIDLKGQLAASTVSQMAFMLLAIALGWPLLALTHLAGHGIYKASRFMGAGAATEQRSRLRSRRAVGELLARPARLLGALVLVAGALLAGWATSPDLLAAMAIFGPAAAAVWWLRSASALHAARASWAILALSLAAYGILVEGAGLLLSSSLEVSGSQAPWWVLGSATVLLATVTALQRGSSLLSLAPVQRLPRRSSARLEEVAA